MDSARCSGPYEEIPPAPGTNQIAGFVEFRPLTSRKKDKLGYLTVDIVCPSKLTVFFDMLWATLLENCSLPLTAYVRE